MKVWHIPILITLFGVISIVLLAACGGDHQRNEGDTKKPDNGAPTVIKADESRECTKFTQVSSDNAVSQGTKIPAGSCAIIEVIDHKSKTENLFAGKIPVDFTPGVQGDVHMNAWAGFDNVDSAMRDMCTSTVPERRSQFPSYTFNVRPDCGSGKDGGSPTSTATATATATPPPPTKTVEVPKNNGNYTRLTGECSGNFPRGDGHVYAADGGAVVPKGTLVYVRFVDNNRAEETHEFGCLLTDTRAGKVSLVSTDIWYGYAALVKTYAGACNQALGDVEDAKRRGSWNFMYTNALLGSDGKTFGTVPATCPN